MSENNTEENKQDQTSDQPTPETQAVDEKAELLKQLDEYKSKYLTAVADLENIRKRFAREREDLLRYGTLEAAMALLPFVDSFTLALDAAQKHDESATLEGFKLLKAQLESILQGMNVQPVAPQKGDDFNPELHESVAEAPSEDVAHHQILDVQRIGYTLHERLLRPAMVILSSGQAE